MVKIGLNRFGTVGRSLLRVAIAKFKEKNSFPKLQHINDPNLTEEMFELSTRYDTVYGRAKFSNIQAKNHNLIVDEQTVQISNEKQIEKILWDKSGVNYVIETDIANNEVKKLNAHLTHAKRVIVTTTPKDVPLLILGVNQDDFRLDMRIVSVGSPSLNCICPLLKVLCQNFNIKHVALTCFYSARGSDLNRFQDCTRCHRSIINMIPLQTKTSTDPDLISSVLPSLKDKIASTAVRVPIQAVGAVDYTITFCDDVDAKQINCKIKESSETFMKGILNYTDDEIASSDVVGNASNCIFDGKMCRNASKHVVKLFTWYDARYSFANTLYDMVNYMDARDVRHQESTDCTKAKV